MHPVTPSTTVFSVLSVTHPLSLCSADYRTPAVIDDTSVGAGDKRE
jgi:hypothetical protein